MRRTIRSAVALVLLAPAVALAQLAFNLTGSWKFAVVTENGTGTPSVTITQKGDTITGTYESGRMGVLPFGGTVKDSSFTFAVTTQGGATLTFKGKILDADHVAGDVDFGGQGGASFTGERRK
ncbi:MAG: hypothetical protein RLZZ621_78 [Gemmatimonadota bacterium]|jgi:hypothetical protein